MQRGGRAVTGRRREDIGDVTIALDAMNESPTTVKDGLQAAQAHLAIHELATAPDLSREPAKGD